MSVVEIKLTADQLAAAYTQLSAQERRSFLAAVFTHPAQQQAALELLVAAQDALNRNFLRNNNRRSTACWRKILKASCVQVSAGSSTN